ncbi:MAG: ABC-F family ATP-binding cassette domain-containing protein [Flavobacteriales bacterium]
MNLLSVENITKSFGDRVLFENISFGIDKGDKIALVARNGSGKSTLMSLLSGKDTADSGSIVFRKGTQLGFLEQEHAFNPLKTPKEILLEIDSPQINAYNYYTESLEHPENMDMASKALEDMQKYDAWSVEAKIEEILFYLGLKSEYNTPVELFSGGQKKRLALAQVLLLNPDLLVLDEPTNHLDLSMIEWLQNFLEKSSMTLLMITHDRYFLDSICNVILEMEDGQLYRHKGNYTYYLEKKQQREEEASVNMGKAKQLFKKELEWMRRQPKARGTKSKAREDSFKDIKKFVKGEKKTSNLEMEISMERLGNKIMELHHLRKSFGEKQMLNDFSYTFKKKDRIGIIGGNGVGKTTFLNILCETETLDGGKVVKGETLKIGYYTQSGLNFDEGKRVIDVIKDIAEVIPLAKGRKMTAAQLLEKFLFTKDMHYSYVRKLSGGERKRLYLLTILMANPNFLILDEPTNDLDIITLNVLEDFLQEFPGCLLIISHDRYFMDKLVDHLFVFEGNGVVSDFPGNYTDFREKEKAQKKPEKTKIKEESIKEVSKKVKTEKVKLSYKDQQRLKQIDKDVLKLQKNKEVLENKFNVTDFETVDVTALSKELHEVNEEIELLEMEWLEIQEKLEE